MIDPGEQCDNGTTFNDGCDTNCILSAAHECTVDANNDDICDTA